MPSSKPHATILLDNNDTSLIYGPGWVPVSAMADIGNETAWAKHGNTYVACSFQGTAISFTGNTEKYWSNLTVIIDNGAPSNWSVLEGDPPQSYMAWYNSPILSDGDHTVNLMGLTGVALDYVTIEAGLNTPLSGSILIVDDNDAAVVYTGSWIQSSKSYFLHDHSISIMPYLNATHYSNTVGDTASLAFTGTSISVYGIVSWTLIGSVSISFFLDGTFKATYCLTSNGTDPEGLFYNHNNFQFFTTPSEAGSHILEINVTEIEGNQIFSLDYFLYQPSFSTLATLSNVTVYPPSSTLSSTRTTSSHSQSNTLSTAPSISSSISPSISPTSYHTTLSPTIGALIGSVIAGVIGGIVLSVLGIFLYKRFSQKTIDIEIDTKSPAGNIHHFYTKSFVSNKARETQSSLVGVDPGMDTQRLSSPASLNSLAADVEALRWRLLEFGRTNTRRASQYSTNTLSQHTRQTSTYLNHEGRQSSSPSNANYIVPMQGETEEMQIQQEQTERQPSHEEGSGVQGTSISDEWGSLYI